MKIVSQYSSNERAVLHHGDITSFMPSVPDESVTLVLTSPPYNIGKEYETRISIEDYIAQQEIIIAECVRVLENNGSICWQVGNYVDNGQIIPLDILLYPIFAKLGLKMRNRIVWTYGHGLHAKKRFSGRYEVIMWFTKSDDYTFNLDEIRVPQKYPKKKHFKGPKKGQLSGNPLGKNPGDTWDIPNVKHNHVEKTSHPCQFPLALVERLILAMTDENDWVLDPYIGSCTTAISALMHKRKIIGAEKNDKYYQDGVSRIRAACAGDLYMRPLKLNPCVSKNKHPNSIKIVIP